MLDGSTNIDCGVSVGTIFGVYKLDLKSKVPLTEQIKCPGSSMVAGGVFIS
jgi:fructose-1,6-bisphosphatase I